MTTTIATVDLKTIHEIYKLKKTDYREHNERLLYFLATRLHLEPHVNLKIALKLRPYGGIIGIDNSSLDTYLKSFKVLRLHAILHDASGFVAEYGQKGPGYSFVLPGPITNAYVGHLTGLFFCLFLKTYKRNLFNLMEC